MFLTLALLSSGYTTKPLLPPSHTMNQIIEETPRIEILPMSQRSQVQNLGEDWTGTGSTALRRRLQNRLNQRASRQRKTAELRKHKTLTQVIETKNPIILDPSSPLPALEDVCIDRIDLQHIISCKSFKSYIASTSIPADSFLLTLLHFNVIRALTINVGILKLPVDRMNEDILSPFNISSFPSCSQYPVPDLDISTLPLSLRPTTLQISIQHHPEIDVFPFPQCRNNLLSALQRGEGWDDVEFCRNVMYGVEGGDGRTGLIVWGDPWVAGSWEVEEAFARKWGWLLRGCGELFESTNMWRCGRGERGIVFGEVL